MPLWSFLHLSPTLSARFILSNDSLLWCSGSLWSEHLVFPDYHRWLPTPNLCQQRLFWACSSLFESFLRAYRGTDTSLWSNLIELCLVRPICTLKFCGSSISSCTCWSTALARPACFSPLSETKQGPASCILPFSPSCSSKLSYCEALAWKGGRDAPFSVCATLSYF